MDQVIVLRAAVVIEIVLATASLLAEFLLEGFLPEALRTYTKAAWDAPLNLSDLVVVVVGLPLSICLLVAWIGIFVFWKHARPLYVVSSLGLIVLVLWAGPTVQTALGTFINTSAALVNGLIIGLLYFSPLRERFRPGALIEQPTA